MPPSAALLESIAADAIFITFPVTDGDSSRWPKNTQCPTATAREVNWQRKMTMEERYACRWRNLIGQGIAKLLGKPDKEKYCLKTFPEGYWMFDHNKGPISSIRHDLYLYGSKTAQRFRSPPEFIPHGLWLLTDPTLNTQNCGCKYCGGGGKKTQTEISEALGLGIKRGPTLVKDSTAVRNGEVRQGCRFSRQGSGVVTTVSGGPWVPKEKRAPRKMDTTWKLTSLESSLVVNSTRVADLRSNRIFRLGELVWCLWDAGETQIEGVKEVYQGSYLWPAVIIDCILNISVDTSLPFGLKSSGSIIQRREYVLRRLGTRSLDPNKEYECTLTERQILPWYAHKMDLPLMVSSISVDRGTDSNLDSLVVALRTAEDLVKFWAVCDRLPMKVPVPAINQVKQETPGITSSSISSSMSMVLSRPTNIHVTSSRSTPASFSIPYSVDTTPPRRYPARLVPAARTRVSTDVSDHRNSLLPQHPNEPQRKPSTVTETCYQGLWYGPERIWIGDLVRLSPECQAFSKSLTLSPEKYDVWRQKTDTSGADTRGVLMRITKIITRLSDRSTKECAVSGPLYELAPADSADSADAKQSMNTVSSSLQRSEKPTVHEPVCPWHTSEQPPLRQDKEARWDHFLDIPPLPLPETPSGYVLRPLLPVGSEVLLPVSFIAGRYYPKILESSLLSSILPNIPTAVRNFSDLISTDWRGVELLSLCALAPGRYNCAVCADVKLASRTGMLREAVREAASREIDSRRQGHAMYIDQVWHQM